MIHLRSRTMRFLIVLIVDSMPEVCAAAQSGSALPRSPLPTLVKGQACLPEFG